MSRHRTLELSMVLLVVAACAREKSAPTRETAPRTAKPVAAVAKPRAETSPAALVGMPGPVYPEHGHEHPMAPPPPGKNIGKLGELLEGDVYSLRLVALRTCEGPEAITGKGPTSRTAVGAEVEVTAKTALNVTPRDATLSVGGITFNGNVDTKRVLKGCAPLLQIAHLKKDEVARGVVIFDIPVEGPGSELDKLAFGFHPARFGGTVPVFVRPKSGG